MYYITQQQTASQARVIYNYVKKLLHRMDDLLGVEADIAKVERTRWQSNV